MDCNETHRLLEVNLDGELDLVHSRAVEAHVRDCPACTRREANARGRREALRENLPRFTAPAGLAEKIRRSTSSKIAFPRPRIEARSTTRLPAWWQFAGVAAGLACALFAGFKWGDSRARSDALLSAAIEEHVRSLQSDHLMDVASTDQHTVKPWFAGQLDFSPPVVDLASAGFRLTGGRLEHLDGRRAAALIYHSSKHAINVFIWPSTTGTSPAAAARKDGYNVQRWSRSGLNFVAVSEIPAGDLERFARAFQSSVK